MRSDIEYLVCANCDTPCYVFEVDERRKVTSAFCQACGADDPAEFHPVDDEGGEDDDENAK